MAYTIKIHNEKIDVDKIREALAKKLEKDGRFKAVIGGVQFFYLGSKLGSRKPGKGFTLRNVRVTKKKLWCGNHPGPCVINPYIGATPKKNSTLLEWDDWVALHSLVNDVLDRYKLDADVWSMPHDVKGIMWMRKGLKRRIKYDYEEKPGNGWAPLRIWNQGTEDQFQK